MYLDAVDTANILGEDIYNNYPFIRDTQPVTKDQV